MSVPPIRKIRESDFSKIHAPMAEKLKAQGCLPCTPLEMLAEAEHAAELAKIDAEYQAAMARIEAEAARERRLGALRPLTCRGCGGVFTALLPPAEARLFSLSLPGAVRGLCPACRPGPGLN